MTVPCRQVGLERYECTVVEDELGAEAGPQTRICRAQDHPISVPFRGTRNLSYTTRTDQRGTARQSVYAGYINELSADPKRQDWDI